MENKRKNIDEIYKWNLQDIYVSWNEWEDDLTILKSDISKVENFKGKINELENFIELYKLEEKISKTIDKLYLYPYLLKDLNSLDEVASVKIQEIESTFNEHAIVSSWIVPEILEIDEKTMDIWIDKDDFLKEYKFPIKETYRLQKHVLSADKEKLLSYFGQYFGVSSDIYSELSISDIKWKTVKLSDGWEGTITNGAYFRIVNTNRNQEDRKKAFDALYSCFFENKNTYASIYRSILLKNTALSNAKNFSSSLEKALERNNISTDVFLTLINSTKENTEPLRRYIKLRKKALKLSEYHYYDNSINIVDYNKTFSYNEAKENVINSVKPLGKDYFKKITKAFSSGWIDVYETENKRNGAYSVNIHDVHPYMLLNFQETLDDVFTLAHELGHTLHSMLSSENQPYATSDYTIFVAEVASTFNEKLLLDYMLQNTNDSIEKIALIEKSISNIVGTFYLQSLFADYEYTAHKLVEDGNSITADSLSGIIIDLFKEYFGDEIFIDEYQKVLWSRIPHFFNSPFYVYQYATSFATSTFIYNKLMLADSDNNTNGVSEKEKVLSEYFELLKSGGNNHPMSQLLKAGVDLTKPEIFKEITNEFNRLLDLLENELKNSKIL